MNDIYTDLKQACSRYWTIRDSGEREEARTQAHNDLLSLFDALGIPYDNREEAANIARDVMNDNIKTSLFVQILERLLTLQETILVIRREIDGLLLPQGERGSA